MRYYLDCEFDGMGGALLSMALIREDERSLHFMIPEHVAVAADPWVIENVLPILNDCPQPPLPLHVASAQLMLDRFFDGDERPHVIADWPDDIRYLCELLLTGPGKMIDIPGISFEVRRCEPWEGVRADSEAVRHNAWWDALVLKWHVEDQAEDAAAMVVDERPPLEVGDTATLKGQGVVLTVTAEQAGGYVDVVWYADDGRMLNAPLPAAALVRIR